MLRKLQPLVLFMFIATICNAQLSKYTAPISKEFTEYIATQKAKSPGSASDRSLGYIPPPVKILDSYTNLPDEAADSASGASNKNPHLMLSAISLPSSFSWRPKNEDVWPIKNQGTGSAGGNCWAFACMASIESGWMVKGFYTKALISYDLSEQNMVTCHGYAWRFGQGGNEFLAMGYLSRLQGPLLESDVPYSTTFDTGSCISGIPPAGLVPETRWISNNRVLIKQTIMDYGAVSADIHYEPQFYSDSSYCYTGTSAPNHAIALVGWNDNRITKINGEYLKGAWIARNQWTDTFADGGYFYISYSDVNVANLVAYYPTLLPTGYINKPYSYDKAGVVTFLGSSGSVDAGLVKYVATQKQSIRKIGTFLFRTGSTVGIDVYKTKSADTLKNLLSHFMSNVVRSPGFYVFDIPDVIVQDTFYIKVTYSTPGWNYPIPIEAKIDTTYANPLIEKSGEQWVMVDGKKWQPLGFDIKDWEFDLVIHAYPDNNLGPKANFNMDKNEVCVGNVFMFTDTSSGNISSYKWNFGANAISLDSTTGKGPHYVGFMQNAPTGLRTAKLKITGPDGTDSISKNYRVVNGLLPLISAPNYIIVGDTAKLTAIADADSFSWYANVGLINANSQVAYFTDSVPGRYKFTVTVTQGICSGSSTVDLFVLKPPPNDSECGAIPLNIGDNGPFTNDDATTQNNEPYPTDTCCTCPMTWCNNASPLTHSVWFKFKGPASGIASFRTKGFDTEIAIYKSNSCDSIKKADLIAANDDYMPDSVFSVLDSVKVIPGKIYWLQVDGSANGDTGTFYIQFNDISLGIQKNKINEVNLSVYPNPNNGLMNVKFSSPYAESFNIEVFDLTGKTILTKNEKKDFGDFIAPINLQGYPKGLYFVNVKGEKSYMVTKFVLQ